MYFKDANHFTQSVKKAMIKGGRQGVAEANKSTKLEMKNEQRKRDLAKKIKMGKPKSKFLSAEAKENKRWAAMNDHGDRTGDDYRG